MLTKELKTELVEFILKKANPAIPSSFLDVVKTEIFKALDRTFDFETSNELCLSLYYGVIFNTLSQLPPIPLNLGNPLTTEKNSDMNGLVSQNFFLNLIKHHRKLLSSNEHIQDFISILHIKRDEDLAALLFKSFNDYLVEHFTQSLTAHDLMCFIQNELETLINQQMDINEAEELTDEVVKPSTTTGINPFETIQLELDQFLEALAPKILTAMSQDPMFQACEYPEDYFKASLRKGLQLKKWTEGFVEKDHHYLRNEAGHFIRNDKAMIWDQMNEIYNGQKTGEEAIRHLFELMNTSEAGFEHYHRAFFNEFKALSQRQGLDPVFKKRVQETLCQLAYLKTEYDFSSTI